MERRGEIVRVRGEKFSLIEFTSFQAGTLAIRGEGRAQLLSGEHGVPDVPIGKGGLLTALDGDFVLVRLEKAPASRGHGPSRYRPKPSPHIGTVVRVLVRKRETVVGRISRQLDGVFIHPFDHRIDAFIRVPEGHDLAAPEGVFVDARFLSYPDRGRTAQAEVLEILGFEGETGVDVEVIARKWGLPRIFPHEALADAEAIPGEISGEELLGRTDFRDRTIVTIDGETARDFDDAIEAEPLPGGGFRLGVHIADVSYFVKPGTLLDAEAYERGTSVYFPDRAIPMLPERLSNGLCSLRPDEDKRTLSAILTIDKSGETVRSEFFRSVIRSRARLTYTAAGEFLKRDRQPGGSAVLPGPAGSLHDEDICNMLRVAARAATLLGERRMRRGALDFDLPDADLILGETGDVVDIVREVRNEAHRLIEEFMLAANEAVARHLEFIPSPVLHRVHDSPDERKLVELQSVLEPLGYEIEENEEGEVKPGVFQRVIDAAAGKPEERFVSELVLRAQKKALYQKEPRGHYALAARHYCHFTSPIRRYPDLLVHRALSEWIESRRAPGEEEAEQRNRWLEEAANQCSERERRAESAEREIASWKKFVFLAKRVGEEFDAYISSVAPFGLFVVLSDLFAEGLVSISSLGDDFYRYDEAEQQLVGTNAGRTFRLGDAVRVRLEKADHDRRQLEFELTRHQLGPRVRDRHDSSRGKGEKDSSHGHARSRAREGAGVRSRARSPKEKARPSKVRPRKGRPR